MPDPKNVTDYRFRDDNVHNRDMLELQSEKAFKNGDLTLAAAFAQASGLYAIALAIAGTDPQ